MHLFSTLAIVCAVMALELSCSRSWAGMMDVQVSDQTGTPVAGAVLLAPPGYNPSDLTLNQTRPPAIMDQVNKQFVPEILIIEHGRHVNFPNSDNIRHHVYSFSKPKVFELKLYAKQPEHPIPFNDGGIVVLGCNIHDHMIGYIVVSDTKNWTQTDDNGTAHIELPDDTNTLRVWHPRLASGFTNTEIHTLTPAQDGAPASLMLNMKPITKTATQRGFGSDRFRSHGR